MAIVVTLPVFGDNTIVYQKQLMNKNMIIVFRPEGVYVPPSQKVMKQFSPGGTVQKPDHVYWYDFVLRTDQKKDQVVWSYETYQYDNMEGRYGKFQIYDAALQEDNLVTTWVDFGIVNANIIRPDSHKHYQPMRWQDTSLQGDSPIAGPIATGAEIEGSLKLGALSVVIKNVAAPVVIQKMGGLRIRYSLKDSKWVLTGPVPETPTPAVDTKNVQDKTK